MTNRKTSKKGDRQTTANLNAATPTKKETAGKKLEDKRKTQQGYCSNDRDVDASWTRSKLQTLKHSSPSVLPIDVWSKILGCLSDDLELKGVRGPSVVARDISNAARVSKELYAASLPAFQQLSSLCPPSSIFSLDPDYNIQTERSWHYYDEAPPIKVWDRILSEPHSAKRQELRAAYLALNWHTEHPTRGSREPKRVLIVEILKRLHMVQSSPVPAQLILAVEQERNEIHAELLKHCAKVKKLDLFKPSKQLSDDNWYFDAAFGSFQLRADCIRHGFGSMEALSAASQSKKKSKKK